MLIDFRVLPPHRSMVDVHFFRERPRDEDPVGGNPFAVGRGPNPSFDERSLDRFLEEMDATGLDHAVVVGQRAAARWGSVDNADIAELVAREPRRFSGFAGIDPVDPTAVRQVRHAVEELGLGGVALVNGWSDPPLRDDAPQVMAVHQACADLGLPVMVTSSHWIGPHVGWSTPEGLSRVAEAFPDTPLIVSHGCWPRSQEAVALAMRHTNVHLMPDFYLYLPGIPGARDYVEAANAFLGHRLLFSSCYPTRSLREAVDGLRDLPFTPEARALVEGANAARLLGLARS